MKRVIVTLAAILSISMLMLSCGGNTGDTESVVSESNRWLELLKIMPENEDTLKAVSIQTEGYVELLRKQRADEPERSNIATPELIAHNPLPLFAVMGYTDQEWDDTLGFNINDVTESIVAGSGPPKYYQAVRGNFSQEDIENAARNGPLNEHMEVMSYKGYEFYSWGEDMDIHMDWRSNVRPLGRGYRLAYVDGFALWMLWTDGLEEMIDSYEGAIPSLADREDYSLLAGALEDMDTVTAFFSTESHAYSLFTETYREIIEDPDNNEARKIFVEEIKREPRLKPYVAFATGAGADDKGYYLAIAILNPDEETAIENVSLLQTRLESAKLPWGESGGNTWLDIIEEMEIEAKGRLTTAKLYGEACMNWDNFSMNMGSLPLLIHE